jgi:Sec-independent protein translocase protein TatA
MFGIGGGEILVVALVALLLFGNEDLPKNMRKMVKAWNDFRGVTNNLQRSWLDVRDQVTRDLMTEQPQKSDSHSKENNSENPVEAEASLPPPEGLHEGTLSQPSIRRAQGSLHQQDEHAADERPQSENGLPEKSGAEAEHPAAESLQTEPAAEHSPTGKSI